MYRFMLEAKTRFWKTSDGDMIAQAHLGKETYIVKNARSRLGRKGVEEIIRSKGAQKVGDLGDHCALPFL